jgi:hypothetical protein
MLDEKRTVTLTNEQWFTLANYIRDTAEGRKSARELWEELAEEMDENGKPKYSVAARNIQYYEKLEEKLDAILREIDG